MAQGGRDSRRKDGGADGVATIGTSAVLGEVNWAVVASASALAGMLSLLTSVAGLPEEKTE